MWVRMLYVVGAYVVGCAREADRGLCIDVGIDILLYRHVTLPSMV